MNKKERLRMYSLSNVDKIAIWWDQHQKEEELEKDLYTDNDALLREMGAVLDENL